MNAQEIVTPDVTLEELSRITRRSIEALRRLARKDKLPGAYRIGRRWMIRAEDIDTVRGKAGA